MHFEPEEKKELITLAFSVLIYIGLLFIKNETVKLIAFISLYLFAGFEVIVSAIKDAVHGEVFSEELLMLIATAGALALGEGGEAAAVMILYRIGEFLSDYASERSRKNIEALTVIRADHATVLRNEEQFAVTPEEVEIGETIVVKPGERVPLDGIIVTGTTVLDTAALTGESLPQNKNPGDKVFSGSINLNGLIEMRVTNSYSESTVQRILDLTETAKERKARTEDFITRFSVVYTPTVVILSVLLAVIPSLFTGSWSAYIHRALVFLTVSCPCALVVSVPLTFFCGIGCASRHGILVKGGIYLEALANTDICAFDKTGTLTSGRFSVGHVEAVNIDKAELLRLCALAESASSHPIAKAICESGEYSGKVIDIHEFAGRGVSASVDGSVILAGNALLMQENSIEFTPVSKPGACVHVAKDGEYKGCIFVSDEIKQSAKPALAKLSQKGYKHTVLLTGDRKENADAIAVKLGISEVYSELMPQDKAAHMLKLTEKGNVVYVGDGINDAPVLALANVGIAMGALGSDAAIESADVVIMDDNLTRLPAALGIGLHTLAIAKQNIFGSLAVKLLILVLGAVGIAGLWTAIVGDVGMLLIATFNALRAYRYKE